METNRTLEIIRNEIERLKKEIDDSEALAPNQEVGYLFALEDVLSFLDTLESEKPMNLEEEIKRYYSDNFEYLSSDQPTLSILTNIARHFYEIGCRRTAEKYDEIEYNRQRAEEKPMNQDGLEEEIREYMSNEDNNPFDWDWRDKQDCARHFAKWQKEQMMKEAVEGEYGYFSNASKTILPSGELNLKEGDKVCIIIVKED